MLGYSQQRFPHSSGGGEGIGGLYSGRGGSVGGDGNASLRVRTEALELAVGELSYMVRMGKKKAAESEEEEEEEEEGVAALRDHVDQVEEALKAQIQEIEAASGLSSMHVRAKVTCDNTKLFPNLTGDFTQDVKATKAPKKGRGKAATESNGVMTLEAGTLVRLIYPQEKSKDGSVYMGGIIVDSETMEIRNGWIQICDKNGNRNVGHFEI